MRIAFGSDERTHLTDFVEQELRGRGHQVELDRHYRARKTGAPVEGHRGRV